MSLNAVADMYTNNQWWFWDYGKQHYMICLNIVKPLNSS